MIDLSLPLVLAQDGATPAPPTPPVEAPAPPNPPGQFSPDIPLAPGADGTTQTGAPVQAPSGDGNGFMLILLLGFVLMFVFMMSGQRKEKKKRAQMLSSLKKGDKVTTVGGVIGNVVEIRENEVVLKVDENSNTRMRFSRAAIQSVVEDKSE